VHGAFFPNLLSNGVADGLVLPTFAVERVIAAAGLLMSFPSTPTQDVVHTLGSCSVGPGLETLGMSEVFSLELTAHPRLGFHAVTAEPFSERQASAIVETMGLHRKLHLLVLERAALVAELEARASPFRPAEIDRLLHLEHSRVAAMAPSGRAAQWS
jgi:hypothetical protein